jgi:quercetin dioxygenase-like cupin family protein
MKSGFARDSNNKTSGKSLHLEDMVKGWFVGAFTPTALSTDACEVSVREQKIGDYEAPHYHKIATEVTVIVSGHARIAGTEYRAGDIVVIKPGEVGSLDEVYADGVFVIVKVPGVLNDKYPIDEKFPFD